MDQLSEGMRSMYLLSLLEAYAQEPTSLPSIILMEDPEIFLHPKMQKTAGRCCIGYLGKIRSFSVPIRPR